MTKSRINQMFSGGSRAEPRQEAIVAHCITRSVDIRKEVITACFASQPGRTIEISINPVMRADMNNHNVFRGNLIDKYAQEALPVGRHFIVEGMSCIGGQRYQARWINLVPYPEKLHKGIVTSSRARYPGSNDYARTLLPFSYQKWADQALLVNDNSLRMLAKNIEGQRQRWLNHEKTPEQNYKHHPLSWLGVRFRALNKHSVIVAASPTLFALPDAELDKFAPPSADDVLLMHRMFTEKIRDQHGDVTVEAMPFQEFYTSMHLKRPNYFLMPLLLDGRAKLGINGEDGKPLLDTEDARFMAVARGFIRVGQQNRDGGGMDDEGFVDGFFGYNLMPVHTAIKTHDGNVAKLQEGLMPADINYEHTEYWLNQIRSDPNRFDSDVARYIRDHPYQELPIYDAMMDRIKANDDLAYRFYEMTNKAVRLSAHPDTVALLEAMQRYFGEGNKTMNHVRTYYEAAQDKVVRNGNATDFSASLVQLWLTFVQNNFSPPSDWGNEASPSKSQPPKSVNEQQQHRPAPMPPPANTPPHIPPLGQLAEEIGIQRMKGKLAPGQD